MVDSITYIRVNGGDNMKYNLSTAGRKCCKGCTWLLSLARNEEGYDLIQFKRGLAEHRNLMKLYPGEPAIILDTGAFYVGGVNGRPILINPNGAAMPQTGCVLCVRNQEDWSEGALVTVSYSDLITSDEEVPSSSDIGRYSCAIVVDESNVPVGMAFVSNWQYSEEAAQFQVGYFKDNLTEFTADDVSSIIAHAEANLDV